MLLPLRGSNRNGYSFPLYAGQHAYALHPALYVYIHYCSYCFIHVYIHYIPWRMANTLQTQIIKKERDQERS